MKQFVNFDKLVYVALLCSVFCIDLSTQEKILQLRKATFNLLQQEAPTCSKEYGVPADTLTRIVDWNLPNDKAIKKFLFCLIYNTGYVDNDGHLLIEKYANIKVLGGDQDEYKKYLAECNKITLADKFDTVFAMGDCLKKNYTFKIED